MKNQCTLDRIATDNARLIAAAPELLDALKATLQLLDANAIALALAAAPDGVPPKENHHPICERARNLLAALSNAEI